jgi:hypothetical protein
MVVLTKRLKRMPKPHKNNGEASLAAVLERLGLEFTYERKRYQLGGVGFQPDFNLAATRKWPELNVELTWADRPTEGRQRKAGDPCLKRKKWKIRRTCELYGVHTVLVTYRDWIRIMNNPRYLIRMIEQELSRSSPVVAAA